MISYLGFPVVWPDGQIFGTICVLDRKRELIQPTVPQIRVAVPRRAGGGPEGGGKTERRTDAKRGLSGGSSEAQSYRELRLAGFHWRDPLVKGKLQNIWIRSVAYRHFRHGSSTHSSRRSSSRTNNT